MTHRKSTEGTRLKAAMKAAGKNNLEVAEAAGVDPVTVSQWRGDRQRMSDDALAKVAPFLGVTRAQLRFGEDFEVDSYAPSVQVGRVNERLAVSDTQSAFVTPRHARNLPLAVRQYLAEFQLRLVKGGATEDEIDEAMTLLRSPDVFSYFKGGKLAEYNEDDVLDGMRSLAEDVVIPRLQKLGRKVK